jgi:hypothetical protein
MICGSAASQADVVISSSATLNVTCSSGVCTPTSANAVLNVGELQTLLANSNVKLAASGEPVNVDIDASLSWVSTNALTLDSNESVNVNQPVAITGGGGLTIVTNDGGSGGVFAFTPGASVVFYSLSSALKINGSVYTLVDDLATLASDAAANASGSYALAGSYNATPDGTYASSPVNVQFAGSFQGLGNTISNLSIVSSKFDASPGVGLFAETETGGTISNVNLQNASIKAGSSGAGGIAGTNSGLIFGDRATGSLRDKRTNAGTGGLVGVNFGTIAASSASMTVNGANSGYTGGLVGTNVGAVTSSYATGAVDGQSFVGGLIGYNTGGALSDSYATGSAKGVVASYAGGFAGVIEKGTVNACYSTGRPKSKTKHEAGGFVGGFVQDDGGSIASSYWDTTTSKTDYAEGGSETLAGVTGETTAQLQSGLPAGFDPTIWAESPPINNGLPYLINNPPQ